MIKNKTSFYIKIFSFIRAALLLIACKQIHYHHVAYNANAARYRSVSRGFAYNGRVNIAHQFAVNGFNANIFNNRAFFNHIGRYKAGLAYCRNDNIRLAGNFGNVFGFAVADGNGSIFV